MTELTIEKMDRINIMITEVAMELLGNKFYDIYGNSHRSLDKILSTNAMQRPTNYDEKTCQLLNDISVSIFDVCEDEFDEPAKPAATRKRRASATEILDKSAPKPDETVTINDPESLLMPMAVPNKKAPAAARIGRRRFTCLDSTPAKLKKSSSPASSLPAPPSKVPLFKLPPLKRSAVDKQNAAALQQKQMTAADNVKEKIMVRASSSMQSPIDMLGPEKGLRKLDKDTMERVAALKTKAQEHYKQLLDESLKGRVEYFMSNRDLIGTAPYHSEYEIVQEYHNGEKERLMYICNQLIEFIKFVKLDQEDSERMAFIANCILQLKDTM